MPIKKAPSLSKKGRIEKSIVCSSSWQKAKGLMFKSKVEQPLVFVFGTEKRRSLHMFFVFCPIDVLFLNKSKRVVDVKKNFRPFTFYTPKRPCQYIIELKAGAIKESKTRVGDKISF